MSKSPEHLTFYLERLYSFLISNGDSQVFPSVTTSIEDILVNIAKDANYLKQSCFDGGFENVTTKLTQVLDKNKDVFTLGYEFKYDDKRKKVLVFKKIPVNKFQETVSVPSKPLRKPNIIKQKRDTGPISVMSSFKISFLNATLKFVKDDSKMLLSYPNMSSEQADFVMQVMDQCMERDGSKPGFKGLYDPLAEALMIFRLKYDFKLIVETVRDMKKVTFEKIRKVIDTCEIEETRVIYEETDSDSSQKQVAKSKEQKKLTTLIDAITHITPDFILRALTEIKIFLKDKVVHQFSNLNVYEQQFIFLWQILTQRVEAIKMLDIPGQIVLDEIRGFLKNKNFKVKIELKTHKSRKRFVTLKKVYPNHIKLTEEEKAARLEAMVLPTMTRKLAAITNGDSSSDTNSKPQTKLERKAEKFIDKTKDVKHEWIRATLTQLRNFLQDEAQATFLLTSMTPLQAAFVAKWQKLLTDPKVIKCYPTDVQDLMNGVHDAAMANKKIFRVDFGLSKCKNNRRDAKFVKQPVFCNLDHTPNENNATNQPKGNGNKTQNGTGSLGNESGNNITAKPNLEPNFSGNKGAAQKPVPKATNLAASSKLEPKNEGNKSEKVQTADIQPKGNNGPKKISKKVEISEVISATVPITKEIVTPVKFEPNVVCNKGEVSLQKVAVLKATNLPASSKLEPKNEGNKNEKALTADIQTKGNNGPKEISKRVEISEVISATVPITKEIVTPVKFEPNVVCNKGEVSLQKVAVLKATNLAASSKLEPKNEGNKSEKVQTADIQPKGNNGSKEISKVIPATDPKKKQIIAPVKFEPNVVCNKGEVSLQKVAVLKATNLAASSKLEPKNEGNKGEKVQTADIQPKGNNGPKEISKKVDISEAIPATVPKKEEIAAAVKFEPKQSGDKAVKPQANATTAREPKELQSGSIANLYRTVCMKLKVAGDKSKEKLPKPIHKSSSLTSLDRKEKKANKKVKIPVATVKLIEGLNQPLVSEKGIKMMRQMGWQGGPLGVRGEGIAEPIMPALDQGKRAGLGSPKHNMQELVAASKSIPVDDSTDVVVNSVDNEIKNEVMQTLLKMVQGKKSQKTEIKYDHKLSMTDWNFIRTVASSFNNRDTTFSDEMTKVLQNVTDHELVLSAAWSLAQTDILLLLSKYNIDTKFKRDRWEHVALAKETLSKRNRKRLVELIAARDIERRQMVTGEPFKHYVMAQILDFCVNCNAEGPTIKEITKDIVAKGAMSNKQMSYIRDVVNRVNCSARSSSNYEQERAMHDDIINAMHGKGYKLSVEFPSLEEIDDKPVHKIISFTKTYGYRAKTVLIPIEKVKTGAKKTNSNKENKNSELNASGEFCNVAFSTQIDNIIADLTEINKYRRK